MALEKIPELRQYVKKSVIRDLTKKTVKSTFKKKTSAIKFNAKKEKVSLEPEPILQVATGEGVFSVLLDEIEGICGLRINFHFSVKLLKAKRGE